MSDAESVELRRFRELGCRDRPGITAEEWPAIAAARSLPFDAAFETEQKCANGHRYRGQRCQSCQRSDPAGAA